MAVQHLQLETEAVGKQSRDRLVEGEMEPTNNSINKRQFTNNEH
jgi:hypothetical protein